MYLKCISYNPGLTVGKTYEGRPHDGGFSIDCNDSGIPSWYFSSRFEIVDQKGNKTGTFVVDSDYDQKTYSTLEDAEKAAIGMASAKIWQLVGVTKTTIEKVA